jgi:para-nitrobenzyl esterase
MKRPAAPIVTLSQGQLIGQIEEDIAVWRGIPYAAPPVGEGRWRPPRPPVPWHGVRLADRFAPAAWQSIEACREVGGGDPGTFSEDCLYLNIWAPARYDEPLPVMVWLHGGGYTIGAGSLPPYEGRALASRGVVVVTVNYRLGHLGFFAHPSLAGEDPEGPLANFALLDQIAALEWVRDNIGAFGGDPQNITLFGESAGGRSVLSLMVSPLSAGLFHKAIAQSAYTLADEPFSEAMARSEAVARHLGLENASAAQLRALPADAFWPLTGPLGTGPVPICGDRVLPQPMLESLMAGRQHPMPLMIGSNSDEASVMGVFGVDLAQQIQRMRRDHRLGLALIRMLYPGVRGDEALGRQVSRDMAFTTMGFVAMQAQQRLKQPCWRYWFDYVAEAEHATYPWGAWHGNEIPYVFDTLGSILPSREYASGEDLAFAARVADYWVAFASLKPGQRVLPGALPWPACQGRQDRLLRMGIDRRPGFKLERRFMRARSLLFKRVMKQHVTL